MGRDEFRMVALNSSSIAAAGYDRCRKVLRLRYAGGNTYDYTRVPEAIFDELLTAPSAGQYVNWRVKPYYPYTRVN